MAIISIIVPVYNAEQYLNKCLDSLIHQTFPDIEILCVNDGSTDGSQNILNRYASADNRVKVFNQPNSGVSAARNLGLDKTSGKYIMFCDSDDFFNPNACESVLPYIRDYDWVFFESIVSKEEKSFRNLFVQQKYYESQVFGGMDSMKKIINSTVNLAVFTKTFRREIIEKNHIRFPVELKTAEDVYFVFLYLFFSSNAYSLNAKLHNYLLRGGSTLDNFDKKWISGGGESKLKNYVFCLLGVFKIALKHGAPFKIFWPVLWTFLWAKRRSVWEKIAKRVGYF